MSHGIYGQDPYFTCYMIRGFIDLTLTNSSVSASELSAKDQAVLKELGVSLSQLKTSGTVSVVADANCVREAEIGSTEFIMTVEKVTVVK